MYRNRFLRCAFLTGLSAALMVASRNLPAQTFGIYRQLWTGLSTNSGALIGLTNTTQNPNWPNNPDPAYTQVLTTFETETNLMDGYGQRLRAFVVPPLTGFYTFWIASSGASALYLSSDESLNKLLRCWVVNGTNPREWGRETNQVSVPISLEAGRRVYLEVLHKAGSGGDNLAVRWQLPTGVIEEPLANASPAGTLLIPYDGVPNPPGIYTQPTNTVGIEQKGVTFSVLVTNGVSVSYQWMMNGSNVFSSSSRKPTLTVSNLSIASNDGQVYSCVLTNISGVVTSALATLSVIPDTVPPALASAGSLGPNTIAIGFTKTVELATATNIANYGVSGGLTVTGAALSDAQTVWLTVSPAITFGNNYTVTVNNVRDRAPAPNTILPNSQLSFTAQPYALGSVGGPSPAGSVTNQADGFDLSGSGVDIGGIADQFQFNYQLVSGDFDVSLRVQSLAGSDVWAKAGLMARDSLAAGSRFASSLATPGIMGDIFEYRSTVAAAANFTGGFPPNYPFTWLRLHRVGNQFSGYASYDGQTWSQLGSVALTLSNTVYLGSALASHVTNRLALAQFRDVGPTPPGAVVGVIPNPNEPLATSSRKTALVISEVMYKPAPRSDGRNLEFIELYNANPYLFDMSGWRLTGSIDFTFPTPTVIQGNAFFVIASVPADLQAVYGLNGVFGPYAGSLKKTGLIQLVDEVGAVRLEIPYASTSPWPAAANGTGHSMVLARSSLGEADPNAWEISDVVGGSPGTYEAFHPSPLRNVVINEVLAHSENPAVPQYIELYNHSNQTNDLSGCVLTDDPATNKFTIPPGTLIGPRGFVVFYQSTLGFTLEGDGDTVFFRNPDGSRILDAVDFEPQGDQVSLGRWPDGANAFYPMAARTPGAPNGNILISDIVINELMYNPISGNDDDQFLELYNKGTNIVDLQGWQFTSSISFSFPNHTLLLPDSYLVVARNQANLLTKYPSLNGGNTVGDYGGKLPHGGGRVSLARPEPFTRTNGLGQVATNVILVVQDEVTYVKGGRWGQWSAGGGSSLELVDPRSNHRLANNWDDSDESAKSQWINIENTGVLDDGAGPADFAQVGILDGGECLVDNVEVRPAVGGTNIVINSDFESGLANWWMEGCFARSTLDSVLGGFYSHNALHLRCSDRLWTGGNSAEAKLSLTTLGQGQVVTLRFKARWLHGWPEVLLRLDGNWLEATAAMPIPPDLGTPGQRNSRAVANKGPAIFETTHSPAVPPAGQPVVVSARVHDPDGVQALILHYRLDPSFNYTAVPMNDTGTGGDAISGDGVYSATVPGQAANAIVAFYISATDTLGASNTFPALLNDFGKVQEGVMMFGDSLPTSTFSTYHVWITTTNANRWANMPNLGNEPNDMTVVYNNRVIYNAGGRFSGSPYHQNFDRPDGALCHYKWIFPDDDKLFGATSFNKIHAPGNGAGDDASIQREQLSHTFLRALGVPWLNRKYVNVFVNGKRRGTLMEDAQTPDGDVIKQYWPNDSNGYLYKMQPWFEFNHPAVGASIGNNNKSWCNVMTTSVGSSPDSSGATPAYLTTGGGKKLARYRWNFLMRSTPDSASNYTNVFSLIDAVGSFGTPNYTANMTNIADMENFMRVGAANHAAGNWDSYMCQNAQNLYGYIGTKGTRYSLLMWDYNIVIGNSGSWGPGANLFSGNAADPNTQNFYNHPPFRRAYWRALQELVNGPLDVAKSGPLLDAKFASFKANGFNVEDPNSAIKAWLSQAQTSIASQLGAENTTNFTATTPLVTVNTNTITLSGTAPFQLMSITVNGETWPLTWTTVTKWTLTLPIASGNNTLTVRGYDRFGNPINGASNTLSVVSTVLPDDPAGKVVITEIMFNPLALKGQFVELYNVSTTTTFDLSGWVLSGLGYTFPPGSSIAPGAFLILAQDRAAFAGAYGATKPVFDIFAGTLLPDGELLTLLKPGVTNTIIDQVQYQSGAPWPTGVGGGVTAASVELIDPGQDNRRAGNWATTYTPAVYSAGTNLPVIFHPAVTNNLGWHFVSVSGTYTAAASTNPASLLLLLDGPGSFYIDDVSVVDGPVAAAGNNLIGQGDFEATVLDTNNWLFGSNYMNSSLSTDVAHSGSNSLHVVCTAYGSSISPLRVIEAFPLPSLTNGELCTLSFWYYASPSATNLTARLAANLQVRTNVVTVVTPAFTEGGYYLPPQLLSPATLVTTPGRSNSVATTLPPFPPLWINELQADNVSGPTNHAGQRTPWIELYNAGSNPVSLNGLYLANNYSNLVQWAFPAGASIQPGEFKVVFCDGQTALSSLSELHTSFLLPSGAGSVALARIFNSKPQVLDFVDYSGLRPDRSYGDFPDGQPFARQSFYVPTPGSSNVNTLPPLQVVINEWMAGNKTAVPDPADGAFEDWFELYNMSDTAADLSGYYLSTSITNKQQFLIPDGYIIAPRGFLMVWCDKELAESATNALHTNFRLAKAGGSVGLFTPAGGTVDLVNYSAQASDVSSGRCPDGGTTIVVLNSATPGTANACVGINTAPVLETINDRVVNELNWLKFTAHATDAESPPQTLTFTLDPPVPAGASITSDGLFKWHPSELQGPSTNFITVRVTDNGIPSLSTAQAFKVTVNDVNSRPYFLDLREKYVKAGTLLSFPTAVDTDWPTNHLTLAMNAGNASGASLDPVSGIFSWTPTEPQVGMYPITIQATDDGVPPLSATATYTVHVLSGSATLILVDVTHSANSVGLAWQATVGATYQIEYKDSLSAPTWTPLGGSFLALSTSASISYPVAAQTQRIYRVLQLP